MKTEHYEHVGRWAELTVLALDMADQHPTDAYYQEKAVRRLKALRQLVKDFEGDFNREQSGALTKALESNQ